MANRPSAYFTGLSRLLTAIVFATATCAIVPRLAGAASVENQATVRFDGVPDERDGGMVVELGDVNGDAQSDLAILSWAQARVYIVFGPHPATTDLGTLGTSGVVIDAPANFSYINSIQRAGDFNGDGYADLLVTATDFDTPAPNNYGHVWVVFGGPSLPPTLDLADVGPNVMHVEGPQWKTPATFGGGVSSIAGIGDLNGDGRDDIAIAGLPDGHLLDRAAVYVVYGMAAPPPVLDVSQLQPSQGFWMTSSKSAIVQVLTVAAAGDVNGDGIPDVIAGVSFTGKNRESAYVLFGRPGLAPPFPNFKLAGIRKQGGFRIVGASDVAGAGDFNGDGLDDVVVGLATSSYQDAFVTYDYVVFGKQDAKNVSLSLASITKKRNALRMAAPAGVSFEHVTGVGDFDGDGFDDIGLLAPGFYTSAIYVVHGGTSLPTDLDPRTPGAADVFPCDAGLCRSIGAGGGGRILVGEPYVNGLAGAVYRIDGP